MSKKIKSATLEAVFEDGSTQKLEIAGHVDIQTKLAYLPATVSGGPFAKLGRTITFKHVPESQITETNTEPTRVGAGFPGVPGGVYVAPQAPAARPPKPFEVGDIVSLPGTHRFAGRPKTTPSFYRVTEVVWLNVNSRWTIGLETRDGKDVGVPDYSQMSVLTKVDRFPLRKGDFVRFPKGHSLYRVGERGSMEGTHHLITEAGGVTVIAFPAESLIHVERDQVKVRKTFELA
jgi:hypothetical protein